MFYQPSTGGVFTGHDDIRQAMWARSSMLFGDVITPEDLASVGIFPVQFDRPSVAAGKFAEATSVEQVDGIWTQMWIERDATPDELAAQKPPMPHEVTMRQARLALLGIGVLAQVAPAIDALEGIERETARIEWDHSSVVHRNSPLVVMMGAALGLDDSALDQLFITAATL